MNKVYFLDINNLKKDFTYEEIYSKVSLYRKRKVDKLKFEKDKWLSLGAEYLLIQGPKEYDIDYSKIEIGFVKNGKPILKHCPKKLYFNLSHSEEMAMCVISDSEVGCDIQKVVNKEKYLEIADHFFHPEEIQMIKNANEKEKKELFFRIWVLKESYIKAIGKGLKMPLKDFRICFENNNPKIFNNDDVLEDRFLIEEKELKKLGYKSAVCIKKYNK